MDKPSKKTTTYFESIPSSIITQGIPAVHHGSHLSNFKDVYEKENKEFWNNLRELAEKLLTLNVNQCPRFVFLCGHAGSGKSHYEVGLYRAMKCLNERRVVFETFSVAIKRMLETFADPQALADCDQRTPQYYEKFNFLFFDDFTASEKVFNKSSYLNEFLSGIICDRWDFGKTLITTTNLESSVLFSTMATSFGSHIVSRLKSDSEIIQFPDQDMRLQGYGSHRKVTIKESDRDQRARICRL